MVQDDGAAIVGVERLCRPLAHALCTRAAACGGCSGDPRAPFDTAACEWNEREHCAARLRETMPVGATIAPEGVDRCLALHALEDPCGPLLECVLSSPTSRPVTCLDGSLCSDGTPCVMGVCRLPREGEACPTGVCETGLSCATTTGTSRFVCLAPGAPGAPCGSVPCAPPSRCLDGVCTAPIAEGRACGGTERCAAGLICAQGVCARPSGCDGGCGVGSSCAVRTLCLPPLHLGEPCSGPTDCDESTWCDAGRCASRVGHGDSCALALCAAGLVCASLAGGPLCAPLRRQDDACVAFGTGQNACAPGLGCFRGACEPFGEAGTQCSDDGGCASGLHCDTDRRCVGPSGAGDGCREGGDCARGFACDLTTARCVPAPIGSVCTPGTTSCRCLPDASGVPVCADVGVEGAPCSATAACERGLVCRAAGAPHCVPAICRALVN